MKLVREMDQTLARRWISGWPWDVSVSWPGNGSGSRSGKWSRHRLGDDLKVCQKMDQSAGQETDQLAGHGNGSYTGKEMKQGPAKRWISQLARIRIKKLVKAIDQTQARR
jgi:hypothetical protein